MHLCSYMFHLCPLFLNIEATFFDQDSIGLEHRWYISHDRWPDRAWWTRRAGLQLSAYRLPGGCSTTLSSAGGVWPGLSCGELQGWAMTGSCFLRAQGRWTCQCAHHFIGWLWRRGFRLLWSPAWRGGSCRSCSYTTHCQWECCSPSVYRALCSGQG